MRSNDKKLMASDRAELLDKNNLNGHSRDKGSYETEKNNGNKKNKNATVVFTNTQIGENIEVNTEMNELPYFQHQSRRFPSSFPSSLSSGHEVSQHRFLGPGNNINNNNNNDSGSNTNSNSNGNSSNNNNNNNNNSNNGVVYGNMSHSVHRHPHQNLPNMPSNQSLLLSQLHVHNMNMTMNMNGMVQNQQVQVPLHHHNHSHHIHNVQLSQLQYHQQQQQHIQQQQQQQQQHQHQHHKQHRQSSPSRIRLDSPNMSERSFRTSPIDTLRAGNLHVTGPNGNGDDTVERSCTPVMSGGNSAGVNMAGGNIFGGTGSMPLLIVGDSSDEGNTSQRQTVNGVDEQYIGQLSSGFYAHSQPQTRTIVLLSPGHAQSPGQDLNLSVKKKNNNNNNSNGSSSSSAGGSSQSSVGAVVVSGTNTSSSSSISNGNSTAIRSPKTPHPTPQLTRISGQRQKQQIQAQAQAALSNHFLIMNNAARVDSPPRTALFASNHSVDGKLPDIVMDSSHSPSSSANFSLNSESSSGSPQKRGRKDFHPNDNVSTSIENEWSRGNSSGSSSGSGQRACSSSPKYAINTPSVSSTQINISKKFCKDDENTNTIDSGTKSH